MLKIVDLSDIQVDEVERKLNEYDNNHIPYQMEGSIQIGIEECGKIIAGLSACITTFKILYIETVFVDEAYRRKGYGKCLINEMEKRARQMGVNMIRLDTFSWQGKEFYEALQYEIVGNYKNTYDGYEEYFFIKRL